MSLDAVRLLRDRPMDGGLPEWRAGGLPVMSA